MLSIEKKILDELNTINPLVTFKLEKSYMENAILFVHNYKDYRNDKEFCKKINSLVQKFLLDNTDLDIGIRFSLKFYKEKSGYEFYINTERIITNSIYNEITLDLSSIAQEDDMIEFIVNEWLEVPFRKPNEDNVIEITNNILEYSNNKEMEMINWAA